MKRNLIKVFLLLSFIFAIGYASNAMRPYNGHFKRHWHKHKPGKRDNNPVGAPLDGGLLTVLGAAGVSYYLVRRKKNLKSEE